MRIEDLRVGNYVYGGNVLTQIDSIDNELTELINDGWFEPITLTEDILLKCGFVHFRGDLYEYKYYTFLLDRLTLWDYVGQESYLVATNIKYLHTLQNLIYALTSEELTIKL